MSSSGWIGGMFSAMGAGVSAEGTLLSGKAEASALNYNAGVKDTNARLARESAEVDALKVRRILDKSLGGMRAAYGASGVSADSGSALDVLADGISQGVLDMQRRKFAGELEAMGYENEAKMDRYYAKQVMFNSKLSAFGQKLNGAASFFGSSGGYQGGGQKTVKYDGNTYKSQADADHFKSQDDMFK